MSGEEAGRPAEAEFLDFAEAREGLAVRAATLVCADPRRAESVVREALTTVAAGWVTAREEGPEAALRAELYRRALDGPEGAPAGVVGAAAPDAGVGTVPGGVDLLAEQRLETLAVLHRLGPRDRALAALRWLEERPDRETAALLDLDAAGLRDAVDALRESLGVVVHGDAGVVVASDDELRELLDLVTDGVPEPALAAAAWDAARARRRTVRRRGLLGAGVALAGGAVAVAVLGEEDRAPGPRPSPVPSVADGRLTGVQVAGATVLLAPDPRAEPLLPLYPDAAGLALPQRLGPGPDRPLEILSPAGSTASVRAAFLVRIGEDRYQPALFLPRQTPRAQLVAMAPLRGTVDGVGNRGLALGPRTIDGERRRLVFAQPGAVVVLEVRSARTQRFPVKDDALRTAGWATDGHTVVASNGSAAWLVDTRTGRVTRAGNQVNAGWADITVAGGRATIRSYSGRGRLISLKSMEGPALDVYGESVSNTEGWACRGAYFGAVAATNGRMQGLVAARGDLRPTPRILAAPASGPHTTYRPLAWGPRDTVLLESWSTDEGGAPVLRVLAWDVIADRLYRVAAVDPPGSGVDQAFTGVWAL